MKKSLQNYLIKILIGCLVCYPFLMESSNAVSQSLAKEQIADDLAYQSYLDFFEEVYQTLEENYYKPVSREAYEKFLERFKTKIYSKLRKSGKSDHFVRWRSAAFMVEALKDKDDIFSAFYPPEPAKKYEASALAMATEVEQRIELGITGEKNEQGYIVTHIEPRSDAYIKGLRKNDLMVQIDQQDLIDLDEEAIAFMLRPKVDTKPVINFISLVDRQPHSITVLPIEFFKQEVFEIPTTIRGIYGLKIAHFNRTTGEDVFRFLQYFRQKGEIKGLILDLRDNPGGPPLAARELSSFFLPGGDPFAFFQKKNRPKAELDVPSIPPQYHYDGPLVILVNRQSGSASELFSGIMQRRKRAVLMGDFTAGQVMLKSMFHFDDESMVLLITARGHHPDGQVFSFSGLRPDRKVDPKEDWDLIDYAQKYFVYMENKKK